MPLCEQTAKQTIHYTSEGEPVKCRLSDDHFHVCGHILSHMQVRVLNDAVSPK